MIARSLLLVVALAGAGLAVPAAGARSPIRGDDPPLSALWDAPTALERRDLFNGPWGAELAPDPQATYTYVRAKRSGVNPGLIVRDPLGRTWHVKQGRKREGAEGPVEVVVSRVLSAVGYHQPPVYFLPSFTLADNSGTHIEPGGRFRLDEPSLRVRGTWSWHHSPFVGTRPHQGLLAILVLFNSWDLKSSNNRIYDVQRADRVETWYVVRDLGGALGESGRYFVSRNDIDKFERSRYITGVSEGFVEFAYHGKQPGLVDERITLEDLRWASTLLASLDNGQWRDAFRAGGYTGAVGDRFIRTIQTRIREGLQLTNSAWRSAQEGR
jgi:hypothetical protein